MKYNTIQHNTQHVLIKIIEELRKNLDDNCL